METFKIEVREYFSKIIDIEASNADEAISKVKEMYRIEEIVLDSDNHVTTEIDEYSE